MRPDAAAIARQFSRLAAPARRIFLERLRDQRLSFAQLPIVTVARDGTLPLSDAQRSLWRLWQRDPQSPAYNLPGLLRFSKRLDAVLLEKCLNALVARHETLRTLFQQPDNEDDPVQIILPSASIKLSTQQRPLAPSEWLETNARAPFQLDRELPIRAALLQTAGESLLVVVVHHIVADGRSLQILIDELIRLYEAQATGRTLQLPDLPVQFADYVSWQRNWLDAGEAERQLAYWRECLASQPPSLELPFDPRRSPSRLGRAGRHAMSFSASTSKGLRDLAGARNTTLFCAVLALIQIVLHRFSGSDDICVGSPFDCRDRPETQPLVGFLVNLLPLRTRINPTAGFDELLATVHATVSAAQSHRHLPLEALVHALQPERRAGEHPLFQVKCTQLPELSSSYALADGTEMCVQELSSGYAHFDLSVDFLDARAGIQVIFTYDSDSFAAGTLERLAEALDSVAEQVIAAPLIPLHALQLPHAPECIRGPVRTWDASDPLALWHRYVAERPHAVAVRADDRTLTYAALDSASTQLANRLVARGVGTEVRVAICADRTVEFVIAMVAVLKAGGVYVPLDPQLPAQRWVHQLTDSDASLLLSTSVPRRPVAIELISLSLDSLLSRPAQGSDPLPVVQAEHSAYMIYTSGSTGQPKGVLVSRGSLANYVQSALERLSLPQEANSLAMVSTIAADLGHTVLFGALCSGRTLHLVSAERAFDPDRFAQYMREHRISVLKIVPSHLRALLSAANPADVLPEHALILGGETTDWPLYERLTQLNPSCRVWNHFGPTETTVGALMQEGWCAQRASGSLPIGSALANVQALILDGTLSPVPQGVRGELYLGGSGLALGYHKRPGLTAERFVANPLGTGQRLYRTGDQVRQLSDGRLEFLGRADDQVKIRGYRVELREVASQLARCAGVAEAEVIARTSEAGRLQIHGYVVAREGCEIEPAALRENLACRLPEYMLPSAIAVLEALPLTRNGKLDRRALPELNTGPAGDSHFEAPCGRVEEALAQVWARLLRVERVGRHDNFFSLGGDSILALQVVAQARKAGVVVAPKLLFEQPTLARLAASLTSEEPAVAPATHDSFTVSIDPLCLEAVPIPRDEIEDIYPLSPLQQGLLLHSLVEHGSGIYVVQDQYETDLPIDEWAFTRAWQEVVNRHAILRTSFFWQSEHDPLQIVHRKVQADVSKLDWSELCEADALERVRAVLAEERAGGFAMDCAPLFRLRLIQWPGKRLRIIESHHHILMDAWGRSTLFLDFFDFYAALTTGSALQRTAPRPYRDFIGWLSRQDRDAARTYWSRALAGFDEITPLPLRRTPAIDRNAPSGAADVEHFLSEAQTERLAAIARQYELTPNTITQGAWALVLAAYAGTDDVLFGVTVAGRPTDLPGIEDTLGLFINTIPLRVRLPHPTRRMSVVQWLRELQAQNAAMRHCEHTPLVEIQSLSELPKGASLFDSLFVFENAPLDADLVRLQRQSRIAFAGNRVHTNYPITVVIVPGERLRLRLTYDPRAFTSSDMTQILERLTLTLGQFLDGPQHPLLDVTALDAGQEERLLALQAGRHVPAAHHCSVVTMFEAQVHSNPTRVAARYLDEQICYGELNRRANRLADALLARGVAPDQVVGIRADRGIDFLVMVLGTLKSGAAYLPLDPKTPPQRVDAILTAARAHMLLSSSMAEELEASGLTDVNPNLCTHPRHLAYVIGTSGSTGVPKGVMVEQRGMLNNQVSKIPYLGLTAQDVVAQTASQNFDIAVWQMLAPLLFGGCVQFVPEEIAQDPARLLEHIAANGVTVLEHVPSLIQEMASADCAVEISKLRWLLATGEALPAEVARSWLSRYPHVRLVNAYGPAECSDDVALHELEVTDADDDSPPPVGYATDNNQLFILDARMNLVPPGGTGELYVAGVGVGRGYAGDPARTAERFVPNPYARAPGDRLYRTGDLARLRSDGAIEFVGRRDHQVKIRGFRIELQEIEAQLRALPQIREAAVVVWAGGRGPRLVAYVVPRDRVSLDVERMRAQLARALPEYMVPATTVVLESLPRNVNGKLDRNALPAPSVLATQQYAAPQGEIEERLAAMWSQVLKVERISRHDNLFDLGGHSLLATQLMARIRRVFGVDIPLRTVLETPVLMSLAEHIRMQGQTAGSQVARIEPVSRDGTLPLSPLQRRVWVVDRLSAGRHGGLRSAYVMRVSLRLVGRLDIAALRGAIDGIIARHEVLRTHYPQDQDGEPAAVIEPAGVTHIELFEAQQRPAGALDAVLPASPSERAAPPAEGQRYVPTAPDEPILDLRRGPVFAANLRREKPDRHVLSLAVHHIAFDGWSQGLFARELVAIYRALTEGHAHGLTPLRIQYVDYAAWQAQQTGERQVMQQFWRDYLREAPVASTIAPDRLRPAVPDTAGATIQLSIPASVTASLTRIANAGRTTLFTVLLGAFCRVLHAHTGAKDLLIGTDVACRDHPDLEDLIGFFVNLIPIRSRATIGSNWLREIRESVLAAFQHRNLPFDEIVEVTGTPRNRAHNPLVQVLFVLQNAPPARIEIPGLAVEALAATTVHSKFDLAVFATPTDGELDVTWVYAESLYEREPINRLTRAFSSLLEELAGGSPCW